MELLSALQFVGAGVPSQMIDLILVLAVVAAAKRFLPQIWELISQTPQKGSSQTRSVIFDARPYLLSQGENAFLGALEGAVGNRFRITMKVRLGDLVTVRGNGSSATRARNQINQKHIDFVLCTHSPVKPLLAIELDDASHDRPDRRARDSLVDSCLDGAGLAVLHVRCRQAYDVGQLAAVIKARIGRG
jgi:very-short-patch-repair endonuclease